MKKVLFATTALVATAGVASADIALSGYAEMGVRGGTGVTSQFHQDIDLTFTMSGTADNGLTFGAAIDIDESNTGAPFGGPDDGGVAVFISGDFGTLTLGDTDGALDWAMTEVNVAGASLGDDETGHAGFSGNAWLDGHYDGQILRYDYSFGDFSVAVSVEQDDDTITPHGIFGNYSAVGTGSPAFTSDAIWAIGAKYSGMFAGGSFGVGIGYQFTDDGIDATPVAIGISVTGISANVALDSGFSAAINYSMIDVSNPVSGVSEDGTHMGIGVGYTFDAITVGANYGAYDYDVTSPNADAEGYGLVAQYDFGGGLAAHLGYGYSDVTNANGSVANPTSAGPIATGDSHTWSFGLSMSF
jgi:outer membrane protein OmpU